MTWNAFINWLSGWFNWLKKTEDGEAQKLDKILAALGRIELAIAALARDMTPPPRPGKPFAKLLREEKHMLIYACIPPADTAPDVAIYEFTARISGLPDQVVTQTKGGPQAEIRAADGNEVNLTVVEIDDAGNRSAASDPFVFAAIDTIPPGQPNTPSVTLLREE